MSASSALSAFSASALAAAGFEALTYDAVEVGAEFTSDDRLLRPEDVEAFAFAVDDHDPWFFGEGPFERPIVHPTLLGNQALFLRHTRYVVPAGLHARMAFRFLAPVELGRRVRTRGRVIDKYERRGKPYMVTAFTTSDDGGTELVTGSFTQMLFRSERAPSAGSSHPAEVSGGTVAAGGDGPGHVDVRAGRLEVGQPLGPLTKPLDQRRLDAYSGVRPASIHTDPAWARAKGFRTTLAQGMMSTSYVSELMTRTVGEGFVVGGGMDVRFIRPVLADDTLTVGGQVRALVERPSGVEVTADVWGANQAGERTMVGTADALVP